MDLLLVDSGIKKAEEYFGCANEWARRLKVINQKLNYWKLYGAIPCEKAMETYILSNGLIDPIELRPDLKTIINSYNQFVIDNYNKIRAKKIGIHE